MQTMARLHVRTTTLPVLLSAAFACTAGTAHAQSVESDVPPEAQHLVKDTTEYAVPDLLTDKEMAAVNVTDEHDRYSVKFGLVLLPADYTTFNQDSQSKQQVGNQQDEFEARSLRVMARGHFELWRDWNYVFSYEYKGFDQTSTADWNATDIKVSTRLGPKLGTLSLGKIKEPFVYEMVGDAANLPHAERLLSPFFVSRNVGVQLSNPILDQRATWAVGVYNDWTTSDTSFSDGGIDGAARLTALPVWSKDGATYLHLAAGLRYYSAANDQLRYRGRPASNVSDYYVNTGNFAGDHALHSSLEALWSNGPYSLLAEYVRADADAAGGKDPTFDGYYLTGSWVLTGEHRPYDRVAGYARRVQPQGRWGAVELIGRYGKVDTTDAGIDGGEMDGWWAGVNWWATRRFKASIHYGSIDLDKDGLTGNTRTVLSRIQWIY
jgi:phosphate-selective porin